MGLLDFLETPTGQALASGVASYAVNARRGRPVNNIGAGLMGGIQGYSGAIEGQRQGKMDAQKEAYNNQMMQYNMTQAETARLKAESERKKLLQQQQGDLATSKMLLTGFMKVSGLSQGFDLDESGELVPTSDMMTPVNANLEFMNDAGDEYKAMIAQGLQSNDPSVRKLAAQESFRYFRDSRKTTKEAKDAIAKERAIAEAMGIPVGDYLRQKMIKQPLVDMRGASFGGNASLPDMGEATKTAGKEFGKFAMEAVQGAQSAYDVAGDISMITEGMRGMGGGPVAEFKAWAGRYMPAGTTWANMASMGELAKTVQTKLAPTMRAAGSGATSDFEMKAFMAAIPTLTTTEEGRELMLKYSQRVADRAQIRAEVVNEIEQTGRLPTPREIDQKMKSRLGDRFFDAADKARFKIQDRPQVPQPSIKQPEVFSVTAPNGKTYTFPDAASLANFKKSAGMK